MANADREKILEEANTQQFLHCLVGDVLSNVVDEAEDKRRSNLDRWVQESLWSFFSREPVAEPCQRKKPRRLVPPPPAPLFPNYLHLDDPSSSTFLEYYQAIRKDFTNPWKGLIAVDCGDGRNYRRKNIEMAIFYKWPGYYEVLRPDLPIFDDLAEEEATERAAKSNNSSSSSGRSLANIVSNSRYHGFNTFYWTGHGTKTGKVSFRYRGKDEKPEVLRPSQIFPRSSDGASNKQQFTSNGVRHTFRFDSMVIDSCYAAKFCKEAVEQGITKRCFAACGPDEKAWSGKKRGGRGTHFLMDGAKSTSSQWLVAWWNAEGSDKTKPEEKNEQEQRRSLQAGFISTCKKQTPHIFVHPSAIIRDDTPSASVL